MKNLCIMPAKGNSKRIHRKPMAPLGDRPLIDWTLEFAATAEGLDDIYILSEDQGIIDHAVGVLPRLKGWLIPLDLVHPDVPPRDAILPMLEAVGDGYDNLVMLEYPKPFRTSREYEACIEAVVSGRFDSCVTVEHVPHWPFHGEMLGDGTYVPNWELVNTPLVHQITKQYVCVGTVVVVNMAMFRETRKWLAGRVAGVPIPRSLAVDIDEYHELEDANRMLRGVYG